MSHTSATKQVRVVHRDALDGNTPQTPGLVRDVAFDRPQPGRGPSVAFRTPSKPGAATGAPPSRGPGDRPLHHQRYGPVPVGDGWSTWPRRAPGDFVFVPSHVIHQEINASAEFRDGSGLCALRVDPVVVNLPELDDYMERRRSSTRAPG